MITSSWRAARRLVGPIALLLAAACNESGAARSEPSSPVRGASSAALTSQQVLPTGAPSVATGAHAKHASYDCKVCHQCGGVLQFDPVGAAVSPTLPAPTFDATTKTCSNVACHVMPAGTFTYWAQGGDGEPVEMVVSYGGTTGAPSWTGTTGTCTGCHGNPPPASPGWHGGHGGGNQCELCHPDAVSVNGHATGLSTATNCGPTGTTPCASLHRNGVLEITARFTRTCFGCH